MQSSAELIIIILAPCSTDWYRWNRRWVLPTTSILMKGGRSEQGFLYSFLTLCYQRSCRTTSRQWRKSGVVKMSEGWQQWFLSTPNSKEKDKTKIKPELRYKNRLTNHEWKDAFLFWKITDAKIVMKRNFECWRRATRVRRGYPKKSGWINSRSKRRTPTIQLETELLPSRDRDDPMNQVRNCFRRILRMNKNHRSKAKVTDLCHRCTCILGVRETVYWVRLILYRVRKDKKHATATEFIDMRSLSNPSSMLILS